MFGSREWGNVESVVLRGLKETERGLYGGMRYKRENCTAIHVEET